MGYIKEILKSPRLLLPVPERDRQDYLDRVRNAVDRYKPLMQQRTGVNLGYVEVKDFGESSFDLLGDLRSTLEEIGLPKAFRSLICVAAIPRFELSGAFWEQLALMGYKNSRMYVSFGFSSKLNGERKSQLDQRVVHELSHHLWHGIDNNGYRKSNYRLWSEGFATYCEEEFFSDLYPSDYQVSRSLLPHAGKSIVENLVRVYGEEILLKIPSDWQKFDSELALNS